MAAEVSLTERVYNNCKDIASCSYEVEGVKRSWLKKALHDGQEYLGCHVCGLAAEEQELDKSRWAQCRYEVSSAKSGRCYVGATTMRPLSLTASPAGVVSVVRASFGRSDSFSQQPGI